VSRAVLWDRGRRASCRHETKRGQRDRLIHFALRIGTDGRRYRARCLYCGAEYVLQAVQTAPARAMLAESDRRAKEGTK